MNASAKKILFAFTILLIFCSSRTTAQYLHRSGKEIVDGNNNPVLLRGMGLGGWMLQEGYMLETNSFANPQHQIRARIADLIGESNTVEFYNAWLANHCTRADIDSLASWGFNSVRLPMHYNLYTLPIEKEPVAGQHTWLETGFKMTDSLLKWCEANQMYLILDLHAAPGGQGRDAAISDYDTSKPSLWESEANKQKTIALWRKLAERYKDKQWIGGYDLINETNWAFEGSNVNGCNESNNAPLRKLLVDITNAIREVDQNHIIYIEGNCWANNHNGLLPYWDNNTVMSFHKYWNFNDQGSVQNFVNYRNQYDLPLWLGETGENSNVWFRNAIKLMEDNNIGWAWWPMKKVGSVVNPLTVTRNAGYEQLLNYWKNGGQKPSVDFAKAALMELANNLKIENNTFRPDVIDAMFRQVRSDDTKPFKDHHAPGVVHFSDYDFGRYNRAYADQDTATYHVTVGTYSAWNQGWSYRNDGVDIQTAADADPNANGHVISWTADNEWLQYTVNVDSSAAYEIEIRYSAPLNTSVVKLTIDGTAKTPSVTLPATGNYNTFATFKVPDVILKKGVQKIRLYFVKGGANMSFMNLKLSKKTNEVPLKATGALMRQSNAIEVSFNKPLDQTTLQTSSITISKNGMAVAITAVNISNDRATLTLANESMYNDVVKLNYNGTTVKAQDGTLLETFTNLAVSNELPVMLMVPGKIEAESFAVNFGLQLEPTTDTGGGQNIGYTNAGDFLDYRIHVQSEGEYTIQTRVACMSNAGKLEFQQLNAAQQVLNAAQIDVPVTNGWQTWVTTTPVSINLAAGATTLRVRILQPEFNLNWFEFTKKVITDIPQPATRAFRVYPNPTDSVLNISMSEQVDKRNRITIRDLQGKEVKEIKDFNFKDLSGVSVSSLPDGVYVIELRAGNKRWQDKFIVKRK